MTRQIIIAPYDPSWPTSFAKEAAVLARALGEEVVAIHHIGSTSVPGMAAKPIIDILVEARAIARVDGRNAAMVALGYRPKGENGIPGRRFFIKGGDEHRTHHVHVFQAGDPQIGRHLRFRDYLRSHPQDALAYAELKRALAYRYPTDAGAYMDGKAPLIQELDRKAKAWADAVAAKRDLDHIPY